MDYRDTFAAAAWISVTERMPKRRDRVLVAYRRYEWSNSTHRYRKLKRLGVEPADYLIKGHKGLQFCLFDGDIVEEPVAWMPLPPPPADAMLRQHGTAVSDNCVAGNQPEMPCPVTEPLPKEKRAKVSDAKPVAWGVKDGREFAELCTEKEEAIGAAKYYGGCTVVPLYRQPQPTLTDAEREALSWFTGGRGPVCPQHLATIRGLMARLS